jgi:hypothetical protein
MKVFYVFFFITLIVFLFLYALPCFSSTTAENPDIVQIDVGTTQNYNGPILFMPRTPSIAYPEHGDMMATALASELAELKSGPVKAAQVVWNYAGPKSGQNSGQADAAIIKALTLHPKILSMSFGGEAKFEQEAAHLRFAQNLNILMVAAAGNRVPFESHKTWFPAALPIKCMLSVGTLNSLGNIASYSNNAMVYLTERSNERGTSFSTARVAGVALWLWRQHPGYDCGEIRDLVVTEIKEGKLK